MKIHLRRAVAAIALSVSLVGAAGAQTTGGVTATTLNAADKVELVQSTGPQHQYATLTTMANYLRQFGTQVLSVALGGTGASSLTAHGVLLGEGTGAITPTAAMTNGQLLVGATGADPAPQTMSQDCALSAAGVITCTKTNNVAFGTAATVNTGTSGATIPLLNGNNTYSGTSSLTGRATTTDGVASGTAKIIGGRATANVSASDTVTAAVSNNSFIAFAQTYVIPANTLKLGSVLRAKALVVVNDASGVDTLTVEMRIGGTTLVATTAVDPGATTDLHLLEFEFVSRADPGAAVSSVGGGTWVTNTGGTIATGTGLLAPTNFATNGALTLDVRAKWSSNTASTSARLEMLNVEIL